MKEPKNFCKNKSRQRCTDNTYHRSNELHFMIVQINPQFKLITQLTSFEELLFLLFCQFRYHSLHCICISLTIQILLLQHCEYSKLIIGVVVPCLYGVLFM